TACLIGEELLRVALELHPRQGMVVRAEDGKLCIPRPQTTIPAPGTSGRSGSRQSAKGLSIEEAQRVWQPLLDKHLPYRGRERGDTGGLKGWLQAHRVEGEDGLDTALMQLAGE
ncbi:hypothetical protein KIPB_008991, partial [Kipferlia bialata]